MRRQKISRTAFSVIATVLVAMILLYILLISGLVSSHGIRTILAANGGQLATNICAVLSGEVETAHAAALSSGYKQNLSYRECLNDDFECSAYDSYSYAAGAGKHMEISEMGTWCSTETSNIEDWNDDAAGETIAFAILQANCDDPLLSLYTGSGTSSQLYVSEKGEHFAVINALTTSPDEEILAMYAETRAAAQTIHDEAITQSYGNERLYIENVYELLSAHISYSDGIDDTEHTNDIYGALVEGESKCAGMAYAFKFILDMEDIPNFVATGTYTGATSGAAGHAWNVVYYAGKWKCCDITTGSSRAHDSLCLQSKLFAACLVDQEALLQKGYHMDDPGHEIEQMFEKSLSSQCRYAPSTDMPETV